MLRRVTAILTMLAMLGLIGLLIWQVHQHRRAGSIREPASVAKFTLRSALIA